MTDFHLTVPMDNRVDVSQDNAFVIAAAAILKEVKDGDTIYLDHMENAPSMNIMLDAMRVRAKVAPAAANPKYAQPIW